MKKLDSRIYRIRKILDYTGVAFLVMLLLFFWQLYRAPIALPFLKPYIIKALNHDDSEYIVSLDSVNLELVRSIKPVNIIANNVVYRKKDGSLVVEAPKTSVSFSLRALLHGIIAPSSVAVNNPKVYVFTTYGVKDNQPAEITKKKLQHYFDGFEEFIERFNSQDKSYTESYINDIAVNNAEVELHEVDLGRKWAFSDLNYRFERHFNSISTELNALLKVKDRDTSIGIEAQYRPAVNKLALQIYFADLIPSEVFDTFWVEMVNKLLYKANIPVSGKVDALINFAEVLQHEDNIFKGLDKAFEKINFAFEGGQGEITLADKEDLKFSVSSFMLQGDISGGLNKITVKDADFNLGEQPIKLSLDVSGLEKLIFDYSPEELKIRLQADIDELALDELYRYWPRFVAEPAWEWCRESIFGGKAVESSFVVDFGYDRKQKQFGFENLQGKTIIQDTNIDYLTGMPRITNAYGTVDFKADSLKVNIDKGVSEDVIITGGYVNLYDLDKYNNYADINLVANSSITDALKLIDHQPLGYASEMGLNPESIKGYADTELNLKFELKQDLEPEEVNVLVKSELKDVEIPDIINSQPLKSDQLSLEVNNQGLHVAGRAELEGIPLDLIWNESFTDKNYKSKYKLAFRFDENFRKKMGIDSEVLKPPYVSGYADAEADVTIFKNNKTQVDVTAALQNTALDFSFLGLTKAVGEKASVRAKINLNGSQIGSIPSLSFNKKDFSLTGAIAFGKNNSVKTVDITSIKAPKTDARAKIDFIAGKKPKVKINISGNSYNLSELFDRKEKASASGASSASAEDELEKISDTDIFIAVNRLWTSPVISIRNFAGNAVLRNGVGFHEVHMVGNFGTDQKSNLKFDYVPRPQGEYLLTVESDNAGSTLKFLRVYDDMSGGRLVINAKRNKNKEFIGHARIRKFSIHNTPVFAKLLTVASLSGMLNLLTGDGMAFSHLDAPFEYKNRVLSVKEAKAFGNVMGITANGTYNRVNERLNIKGVIAPAYSINSFIGKIPIVGNLLSSKDGTVFAANYSITGSLSDPDISFNPLSALSPGSLKDLVSSLFGSKDE